MTQKLDLESWNRKEHFEFFNKMQEPFFGISTNIDCTLAYANAKKLRISFFTYYLHKTLIAVNQIENFKHRIIDNDVYIFDTINASATILRDDKTFGFSLIDFNPNLDGFVLSTKIETERVRQTTGLFTRDFPLINLIHFSTLPWVNFTSFSHARNFDFSDSCPKITFGKMIDINGTKTISMSVHVHHGLVDGYHVGEFVNLFQELMDN
ncbi:MAG: chloramphenicol acetyltransferase [Flavobacterium sp.]|nr:chloramphenicol acetyltransferase [Flavobacterium sp.]